MLEKSQLSFLPIALVARIVNPSPVTETGTALLHCENLSPPEVSIGSQWFRLRQREPVSTSSTIFFSPPRREDAGLYMCRIASLINNDTLSLTTAFVVECK